MSLNRSIGSAEYMKKKIPKNEKYQHVKTRLDTGCSLTKYLEKIENIKKNYRYRKDEIFKRLKVSTFAQLVLQVASVSELNDSEIDGESHRTEDCLSVASDVDLECLSERTNGSPQASPPPAPQQARDAGEICHSARSTLLSVISGMGEMNVDQSRRNAPGPERADGPYPDCPYLLLDVRDRDQYDCCHIISAHSFPIATLSRTMNPYTKDVLEYVSSNKRFTCCLSSSRSKPANLCGDQNLWKNKAHCDCELNPRHFTEERRGEDHHRVRRGREDGRPGGHRHVPAGVRQPVSALRGFKGDRSEISRGDDDGLHPGLVLLPLAEGEEELRAATGGGRGEVAVHVGRAQQDPGAAGGDTHPQQLQQPHVVQPHVVQ
ncbi:centrosomal protein of 41 kDa isoform X1 [Gasterosteus aculeatus]|uniref:centrosomal protein of 41 kDa isoform X1 n=1 Tax=Gasterosteus aculeatus aculeatus TaxID=481459 RepID=UPI001A99CD69|nr:centrosomal protein of 41 kDa isoform X1 [Gasterosteus aculeatus aculeatus]